MSHENQAGNQPKTDLKIDTPENLDGELRRIATLLADIPDAHPPDTLIDSVMAQIRPKRVVWWKRLWRQLNTPVNVSPLRIAQASACVAVLLLVTILVVEQISKRNVNTPIPQGSNKIKTVVVFTLEMPEASNVELIGSFNQWTANGYQMRWDQTRGLWTLSVPLEGGRYEYAYLVDGQYVVPDPKALMQQEDGFGNKNSIIIIEKDNGHETKT